MSHCAALLLAALAAAQDPAAWPRAGTIQPRHARDVASSNWSIGAETMDRDYTVYRNWREYLGPLGFKKARLQSGWAKTEKEKGKYDFAWLDGIVRDMAAQGVEPWMCLCYGNPLYQADDKGTKLANLGSNPSTDPAVTEAWVRYVGAVVDRYKDAIDEWELWNEPRGGAKIAADYARFMIVTAEAIRARQPSAKIIGFATAGIDLPLIRGGLEVLKQEGKLGLLDFVCYHPYSENPDASYAKVAELRKVVESFDPRLKLFQGENGAPSQKGGYGAIAGYAWDEERQAKWALRRLLGDLGRDIPSSYFSICDMQYTNKMNYKGLLAVNADKVVERPKQSYFALQRLAAVFDDRLRRVAEFTFKVEPEVKALAVFAYADASGARAVTVWKSDGPPRDTEVSKLDLAFEGGAFKDPVYADLLKGEVLEIPRGSWTQEGNRAAFKGVPVYDSPVVIAERGLIPLKK